MPFAGYEDFDDCVRQNQDQENPEGYCAVIEAQTTEATNETAIIPRVRFQIVPVIEDSNVSDASAINAEVFALPDNYRPALSEDVPEGRACGNCSFYDESKVDDSGEKAYCTRWDDFVDGGFYCNAWQADDSDMGVKENNDSMNNHPDMEPNESGDEMQSVEDFHSLLVVEGVWTGDGRYIEEGALSFRELPLPLMAIDRTTEAHMEAVLIGNITRIQREGRELHGYGYFIKSEDKDVMRLQTLIKQKELRGISVDLDAVEYEVLMPMEANEPTETEDGEMSYGMDEMKMKVTSARIMGATVVPFPAFQEAFIESLAALTASLISTTTVTGWVNTFQNFDDIDFIAPQGAREEALKGLEWREEYGRGGTDVGVARARDISNGKNLSPDTIGRMVSYFARHEVDKKGQGWSPDQDGFPSAGRIAWALWGGDAGRVWSEKVKRQMESREEVGSIVASGHPIDAPIVPPSQWFSNPELNSPTPLTVTDEGRIFGHLAVWGQCHIGHTNRCVEPPASITNYAHFLTGEILCDDGKRFPVGQITMNGNHASHNLGAQATAAHYDNTALAAADVTAGEDAFGIWVSGSIRPDLHPNQIRGLMASDVSGDWRRIGGNLELVAVLAVNVPGFPKIRVSELEGLVASLSLPAFEPAEVKEQINAIAASIGRSPHTRQAELISKVHGKKIAQLAKRIKGDL